jgi:hypothetical protein
MYQERGDHGISREELNYEVTPATFLYFPLHSFPIALLEAGVLAGCPYSVE